MFRRRQAGRRALCRLLSQLPGTTPACHTSCNSGALQTATAAAQTLAAVDAQQAAAFAPVVPPGALRPLAVSKERLSLKGQVIFESSWKRIEEKYKEVR